MCVSKDPGTRSLLGVASLADTGASAGAAVGPSPIPLLPRSAPEGEPGLAAGIGAFTGADDLPFTSPRGADGPTPYPTGLGAAEFGGGGEANARLRSTSERR